MQRMCHCPDIVVHGWGHLLYELFPGFTRSAQAKLPGRIGTQVVRDALDAPVAHHNQVFLVTETEQEVSRKVLAEDGQGRVVVDLVLPSVHPFRVKLGHHLLLSTIASPTMLSTHTNQSDVLLSLVSRSQKQLAYVRSWVKGSFFG